MHKSLAQVKKILTTRKLYILFTVACKRMPGVFFSFYMGNGIEIRNKIDYKIIEKAIASKNQHKQRFHRKANSRKQVQLSYIECFLILLFLNFNHKTNNRNANSFSLSFFADTFFLIKIILPD